MSDFANKINNRRKELGLSYEEVYARVLQHKWSPGVEPPSESTVGNWLGGLRRPRHMEHLTALCNALDLSLDEAVKDEAVSPLTAVESTLLKVVRDLTDEQAQAVLAIASTMAKK